ncbi:hypothetical protein FA13DRAFT_1797388 [Coprinellus micaceus]|uniref:Uncharacterized protein n=1 Tax=Coprinellus micaceus TaxID=71717 RepID=A0A4Y7SQN4_COPMI|nr:hypothetical protein FA13DRAFT_1797388 [Coprinellus micaceus]
MAHNRIRRREELGRHWRITLTSETAMRIPHRRKGKTYAPIFMCKNHPRTRGSTIAKRVFVMLEATDRESMKTAAKNEAKMEITRLTSSMEGVVNFKPGDFIFIRDPTRSNDPNDDVLCSVVAGPEHYKGEHIQKFEESVRAMIGNRTDGATAFEATGKSKKTQGNRCFQHGGCLQRSKCLLCPAAAGKGVEPLNEYQKLVQDYVMAASDLVGDVAEGLPTDIQEAFKAQHDIVNYPTIGKKSNYIFPQIQTNISMFGGKKSRHVGKLNQQIGHRFGGAHFDGFDHPVILSFMFCHPILPEGWHPGYFFLLELGGSTGASDPFPLPGYEKSEEIGWRFNGVFFASKPAINGRAVYALASKPTKLPTIDEEEEEVEGEEEVVEKSAPKGGIREAFTITPEMTNIENKGFVEPTSSYATYTSDGSVIMDADSQMNYVGRSLLQHATYIFRQMPPKLKIHVDQKKFLESISYTNEDRRAEDVGGARRDAQKKVDVLERAVLRTIPSISKDLPVTAVAQRWEEEEEEEEEGQRCADNIDAERASEGSSGREDGAMDVDVVEKGSGGNGRAAGKSTAGGAGARKSVAHGAGMGNSTPHKGNKRQRSNTVGAKTAQPDPKRLKVGILPSSFKLLQDLNEDSLREEVGKLESHPRVLLRLIVKLKEHAETRINQAWRWVEGDVVSIIKHRLIMGAEGEPERERDWLDDMILVTKRGLKDRSAIIIYDPAKTPRLSSISHHPFEITNQRHVFTNSDNAKLRGAIINVIRKVLPTWIGLSEGNEKNDREGRIQACVVEIMRRHLGEVFLTTDVAWKAYSRYGAKLQPFEDALSTLPILQEGTTEHELYMEYRRLAPGDDVEKLY